MPFWCEVLAGFLANMFAGVVLVLFYVGFQWFLQATDVPVSYNWSWEGTEGHPNFDIRNRSKSKTYFLATIEYRTANRVTPLDVDNVSLWGKRLEPGTISKFNFNEVKPVKRLTLLPQLMDAAAQLQGIEIVVSLQTGRKFWLKGQ